MAGLWLISSLGIWDCAGPGRSGRTARSLADSTVFHVPESVAAKREQDRFFQEYQSGTGWNFTAVKPIWIEVPGERTDKGYPVRTLVRGDDRKVRISLFETTLPKGHSGEKQLTAAFAYLFKADPDSSAGGAEPPAGRAFLFKSPEDTLKHWGLMMRSDSSLLFVSVESKMPLSRDRLGGIDDIRMEYQPSKPGSLPDSCLRSFRAAIENTLGLKAVEDSNWTAAMKHFQKALDLDAANAAYLVNCAAIFQVRKETLAGLDFLSRFPKLLTTSGELAGIMGALFEELGKYQEAKDWALKALELEPENTEWLINLSDALWGLGERVHSKNVLLRRYSEKPTFRLSVYLASTYLGLEEYENARQVLVQTHADTVPNEKSAEYYLRALAGLKDYEGALDFVRTLGNGFPPSSNNYLLKGECEFNLKLYRLAGQSAKQAVDLDPANREAQQLATQVAALMGNRSNLILRTPISPLKTRASLSAAKALMQKPDNLKLSAQSPLTMLTQDIVYSWAPKTRATDGRWKKTRHQFYHIKDAKKLFRMSELTYEMNPGYSRFYVNAFRLYDGNGKVVESETAADFYVTKSHNTTLHPENLLVHLPLKTKPGVQFLEAITTEESQLPVAEFPYLRYDHAYPFPVLNSTYEILHPPKHLLLSAFGETKVDSLPDRLVIRMDEPTPAFEENFRPYNDEFGTGFSITPFTTWREVGRNYQRFLEKSGIRLDSIPVPVQERAAETMDKNRGVNPVMALYRFVRDSVRYNNYEFSLQALVPERCEAVLTNGYSDCKGHALLLMQMLKARNLEAHLCLVSLNHAGDIDQPSLHQFNHMIVHVPAQKGLPQYFLDPTEKSYAFRRAPLALEGKNVLIIDDENSRMATIPELDSAGEHRVQVFHNLKVDPNQTAIGSDSLVLSGKVASEFRAHMRAWNPNTKFENLLSWLAQSYPAFADERFRVLNENDPDLPLVMVFRYRAKFPFRTALQEFEHFPKLELSFLRFPRATSRKAPVYFPHEIQINSQWVYEIPEGYGWKSLNLDRELSEHYLHWLLSINQGTPESIVIKQNWRIDPFVATPEEYAKIQAEWDPILARSSLRLVISKR
ncbi:MAG: Tetratricopeptide 2 repeat protein [Fibrobacteres bacterium]|nr:Tetratricopeptide 2 repeat protein [Fibrobacterota bacterium]